MTYILMLMVDGKEAFCVFFFLFGFCSYYEKKNHFRKWGWKVQLKAASIFLFYLFPETSIVQKNYDSKS